LIAATTAGSNRWAESLAAAARKKASLLEQTAARSKSDKWRKWLGATDSERSCLIAPSKRAYRWVKGLAGWEQSSIGDARLNDDIPDDGDNNTEYDDASGISADPEHTTLSAQNGDGINEPLCDQAGIEVEANSWAELWAEGIYLEVR
jgi:hypothetical protein